MVFGILFLISNACSLGSFMAITRARRDVRGMPAVEQRIKNDETAWSISFSILFILWFLPEVIGVSPDRWAVVLSILSIFAAMAFALSSNTYARLHTQPSR